MDGWMGGWVGGWGGRGRGKESSSFFLRSARFCCWHFVARHLNGRATVVCLYVEIFSWKRSGPGSVC